MGYMVELKTELPQRTIALLEEYGGRYSETLLLNCLVGLLIIPKEKWRNRDDLYGRMIGEEPVWGLKADFFDVNCQHCGLSMGNVVRQLRNAVAHAKVEAMGGAEEGQITGFKFRDSGFTAQIPIDSLRLFVLEFAQNYLHHYAEDA